MKQIILTFTLAMAAATNLAAQSVNSQQTFSASAHEASKIDTQHGDQMVGTMNNAAVLICQNTVSLTSKDMLPNGSEAKHEATATQVEQETKTASLTTHVEAEKRSSLENNLAAYMSYKQEVFGH